MPTGQHTKPKQINNLRTQTKNQSMCIAYAPKPYLNNIISYRLERLPFDRRHSGRNHDHQRSSPSNSSTDAFTMLAERVKHDLSTDHKIIAGHHCHEGFVLTRVGINSNPYTTIATLRISSNFPIHRPSSAAQAVQW